MADPVFTNRARNAGSGFTLFTFGGQVITFCDQVALTTPSPVGQGVAAIQPMDEPYPVEIMTAAAAGMGQITLNMIELFGSGGVASKVWDRLGLTVGSPSNPFGSKGTGNASTNLPGLIGKTTGIFQGAVDIVDIFIRQAQAKPEQMMIVKIIRPVSAQGPPGSTIAPYTEEYHGCVITNVVDGEQVAVGSLQVIKQITVAYRYATRNGQPSAGFALRDNPL